MASKNSSRYDDGEAFRYDFPDGLLLSTADLIDGMPKLHFIPSLNVSSITEEDVAICARLSQEKIRPEFVYISFPSDHPFHGRQYKDYRPSFLRGTSIGELLAEADWKMKCLCVGVKSDESKTKFMSWAENSQLDGLTSSESFSASAPSGSVFMKCKSVEVCESEEEISFSDPKMTIAASNQSSFSKYLTALFDAIAFYDEPRFSKIKEVIKLILAMEWFVRKGVKFSMEWINENFDRSRLSPRQVVAVKSPKLSQEIIDHVLKQLQVRDAAPLQSMLAIQLPLPWSAAMIPAIRTASSIAATATESNFQIKHVRKIGFPAIVSKETTLTISIDDFDMLYQEEDPNSPLCYDLDENGKPYPIIPNVESWSELFAETVPNPCKALVTSDGESANIVYGGVSTTSIPVTNVHLPKAPVLQKQPEIRAVASSSRKRQSCKRSEVSTPKMVMRPSTNAASLQYNRPLSSDVQPVYGYTTGDTHTRFSRDGRFVEQQQSARVSINQKLSVNGRQITATSRGSIPLPAEYLDGTKVGVNTDQVDSSPQYQSSNTRRDNLTLQLSQPEQPAAVDKMSPTFSTDSGVHDCVMPQHDPSTGYFADDVLSPTDTIDSGLGLQDSASTC